MSLFYNCMANSTNPLTTLSISTDLICNAPVVVNHKPDFVAEICSPVLNPLPVQIEATIFLISLIATTYYTDGISAWKTGATSRGCNDFIECYDSMLAYPYGGSDKILSPMEAFEGSVFGKIQVAKTVVTITSAVSKTYPQSYNKGIWIDDFDGDLMSNWKLIIPDSNEAYYRNFTFFLRNFTTQSALMRVVNNNLSSNCSTCAGDPCADEMILKCETTGKVSYSNNEVTKLENLNHTTGLYSVSSSEFMFLFNKNATMKQMKTCLNETITKVEINGASWYLKESVPQIRLFSRKSNRTKRQLSSSDEIWYGLDSLSNKLNNAINLISHAETQSFSQLSNIIIGLSQAIDLNLNTIADSINYYDCIKLRSNHQLANQFLKTNPKLSISLLNDQIDPDGIEIVNNGGNFVCYRECDKVILSCIITNITDLIQNGLCYSIPCLDINGNKIYQINNNLYNNRISVICDKGTFWTVDDGIFTITATGSISKTSKTEPSKISLININETSLTLLDEINTLRISTTYSGAGALAEQVSAAIGAKFGTQTENVLATLGRLITTEISGLIQDVLNYIVYIFVVIQMIFNLYLCVK